MTRHDSTCSNQASRLYYGWVMVAVAIGMAIATMPGQTVLVSLFNASYRETFGIGATQLSTLYMIGTMLAAVPLAIVGRAADRFGLRVVTGVVAVLFATSLVSMARIEATGIEAALALGIGFFLIRFLGQGSLGMLAGHTIAMWFERKLGRVHSLLVVGGFAGGSALLPIPLAWAITNHGWQQSLWYLAALVILLTVPSVLVLFRNKPEDIGQHLDGDSTEHKSHDVLHGGPPPADDPAFTLKEALGSVAFWTISLTMIMSGLIGTALIFHMAMMLESAGLEGNAKQAAAAIMAWPVAHGLGAIVSGWAADRYHPSKPLSLAPLLMVCSCVVCIVGIKMEGPEALVIGVFGVGMAVFGLSQSLAAAVGSATIARYFGRTNHGSIRGFQQALSVAGTGAGPVLASVGYDVSGQSFVLPLLVFAGVCLPLAVASYKLKRPRSKMEAERST